MSTENISRDMPVITYEKGESQSRLDRVIREESLKIYLKGDLISETPVTPRDLPDLVMGYLYGEGLIRPGAAPSLRFSGDDCHIEISDTEPILLKPVSRSRSRTADEIFSLMDDFYNLPSVYHETGGAHMAAFAKGRILHWADDISRRNAVDKVLGKIFLNEADTSEGIILSSGRISSDMILRMVRVGIPMIASVSAPSDKAVELAIKYDITVCGFVRGRRFNLYSGKDGIIS